jgi:hypothetical protein
VDGTGCHGFEAQSADAAGGTAMDYVTAISTSAAYNSPSDPITGAAGFNCSPTNAQLTPYCWHLPSRSESLYLSELAAIVGGYSNRQYWTSTGRPGTPMTAWTAWIVDINNGANILTDLNLVRAGKAF